MENISVEVILFGALILVVILDFVFKGRKNKNNTDSVTKKIEYTKEGYDSFSLIKHLSQRNNFFLFLVYILIFKIFINYSMFKYHWFNGNMNEVMLTHQNRMFDGEVLIFTDDVVIDFVLKDYIRYAFEINLGSFIYAFILVTFIVWGLNSFKLKR